MFAQVARHGWIAVLLAALTLGTTEAQDFQIGGDSVRPGSKVSDAWAKLQWARSQLERTERQIAYLEAEIQRAELELYKMLMMYKDTRDPVYQQQAETVKIYIAQLQARLAAAQQKAAELRELIKQLTALLSKRPG